jgi:hypothetical protein
MKSIISLSDIQRRQLFEGAAQRAGMQEIILEKDFWVCWTLRELFALPGIGEHLIFKGGTSLSKAWGAIARFSEDIDISLSREWLGFGGERDSEKAGSNKKTEAALENLTNACIAKIASDILPALKTSAERHLGNDGWNIWVDAGDPQTLRFKYPSSFGQSAAQLAYVPREVKIEFGARSDDWPADMRPIRPYVAEAFPDRIADAVEKDYKDMREMFFGEPLSWDTIISRLRKLESQINDPEYGGR